MTGPDITDALSPEAWELIDRGAFMRDLQSKLDADVAAAAPPPTITVDDLKELFAKIPEPSPSDVVRVEIARTRDITRLAAPEDRTTAELRRLGLLPPLGVIGLPIVVDPTCPAEVVRLVARDGSTSTFDLSTGRAIVIPPPEENATDA